MIGLAGLGCRPLVEVLSEVPDFRKSQGRRHPLGAVLALACAATLCGYKSYGAMAEWGKNYGRELAQALGFKDGKTPSVGTLFTIFSNLDKRALEAKLGAWAECVLHHLPGSAQQNCALALMAKPYGKTLWQNLMAKPCVAARGRVPVTCTCCLLSVTDWA